MVLRSVYKLASDSALVAACDQEPFNLLVFILVQNRAIVSVADMNVSNKAEIMFNNLCRAIAL